ncbi:Fpg/Nei family DNA glycosylase [Micrococcus luteus]|uniref:Fpg/Nei family DNA glycosylase n=1 Tax=Micrococcus luteus TaxID=1270 RepID=UPI001E42859C|nr:DNA glycosylase [Micrococcus luteus]MCD0178555.1 Fpg/Nei family DNA glycosylase [Micrococcus luteus]
MPEGHSIHRLARQFTDVFGGRRIRASSPQGRFAEGAALLDGQVVEGARAHGKHFLADVSGGHVLHVHLGMYGAWTFGGDAGFAAASSIVAPRRIREREVHADDAAAPAEPDRDADGWVEPPPPAPTARLRVRAEHGWADLIGASRCRVLTPDEAGAVVGSLGPDPLNDDDPGPFLAAAARTRRPIGVVLMDQSAVGGIGNIYRAEALFRAGLDPWRPARDVPEDVLATLWEDNAALMREGVRLGRIITTCPEHRPGVPAEEAWPEHANYVYQRQGRPCLVCGREAIVVEEMAARKLYRCLVCQR